MKTFLLKLTKEFNIKDISQKEHKNLLAELKKLNVFKQNGDFFRLKTEYRFGKISINSHGTGFLEVFDSDVTRKDLLIESKDLMTSSKNDIVLVKRVYSSGRPKAKVIYIIKKAFETQVGYLKKENNKAIVFNIKTNQPIYTTSTQKCLKALPDNTCLKIDAQSGIITEVLGVLEDPLIDEKIVMALYNKNEFFSDDSLLEARSHGSSIDTSLYPNRIDLRNLNFCTIDPNDAKDFDDAIFFDEKNQIIYIAIADVSEYVHPFGHMDKEARKRGFSIYFPHKSIPMLPRELSEHICSLKPNEDRLVFGFAITINKNNFEILKEELFEGIINSSKRYTYDEVDSFLIKNKKTTDFVDLNILEWLTPLYKITKKLRQKRLENAFHFDLAETRMKVDNKTNLISTSQEKETPSHSLIEECMLLANKAAAKLIEKGIYRVHETPTYEKLQDLLSNLMLVGIDVEFDPSLPKLIKTIQNKADALQIRENIDKLIIKAQKQAFYSHVNMGHFGLGFESYSHFTSPIRRYSDLTLHRLLKAKLHGNKKLSNYLLQDIDEICSSISNLERESDKVAWEYMDRKFARWALANINSTFNAIVTEIDKNIIAKLDDEIKGARILIANKPEIKLFENVKIRITQVDIISATIYANIV